MYAVVKVGGPGSARTHSVIEKVCRRRRRRRLIPLLPSFLPSLQHVNAIRNPISPNRFAVKLTGMAVKRAGTMEKKLGTVMLSPGGFRGRHSHLFQS